MREAHSDSNDPPAGLVETIADPNGVVTRYRYNQRGLPIEVTFAEGTAVEASVYLEYDAADNLTAEIDELGRRTEYLYDALGRVIE